MIAFSCAPTPVSQTLAPAGAPTVGQLSAKVGKVAASPIEEDSFRAAPPPDRDLPSFTPPPAVQKTLRNGVPLYVLPAPGFTCSLRLVASGGIPDSPPGRADSEDVLGMLLAYLGDRGTSQGDESTIARRLASAHAAWPFFYLAGDYAEVSILSPADKFADATAILFEIVLRPSFPEADFEPRREQVARSLEQSSFESDRVAVDALRGLLSPSHPYGSFRTAAKTRAVSRVTVLAALYGRLFDSLRLSAVVACSLGPEGSREARRIIGLIVARDPLPDHRNPSSETRRARGYGDRQAWCEHRDDRRRFSRASPFRVRPLETAAWRP